MGFQVGPLSFAGTFSYAAGSDFTYAVRYNYPVDLNNDGVDELIFAGFETQPNTPSQYSDTKVTIFGWENGRFQNLTDKWLPDNHVQGVGDIAAGDFNNDGLIDLYLSGYADMDHQVQAYQLLNTGTSLVKASLGLTEWEHGAAAGDLDNDGFDDVVVFGYLYPVPLLRGGPQGLERGFASAQWPHTEGYATNGSGGAVGDFYGDGTMSVVVSDNGTITDADTTLSRVHINAGGAAVGFSAVTQLPMPTLGTKSHDVRAKAFDFNDDGLLDVLVFSRETWDGSQWPVNSRLQFLENQGNGRFVDVTEQRLVGYPIQSNASYHPVFADFNRDGLTDIFISESSFDATHNSTAILLQTQDGQFIDTGRSDLSRLIEADGGMAGIVRGPDQSYYLVTEYQSRGGQATVYTAKLSFPEREERDTPEKLKGTRGADHIWGFGGADTISGSPGNDTIDGGAGVDLLTYNSNRSGFDVAINLVNATTILRHDGIFGVDTLINIELLAFTDVHVTLDVTGTAAQAYRLYEATFNRAPDKEGMGYWIWRMDNQASLLEVANEFVQSTEFETRYGADLSNTEFSTQLYQNVLDRFPDPDGLAYWVKALESGQSRAAVLAYFSESPENQTNTANLISTGIEFTPFMG
ncbi:FG-GAP-like repeat-containing protein [Orrella daihaiensis]|uniref:VCBS repeat-containing protein n=1 Tax=Orrella daihaiensis TaxID=2782176 RepID=A0ABY4AJL4_9BURK|nr:FG-GAP-like repeat-containing protein [Orrella daihaiensis]UOD50475.1 VCBS repeat-containing protein [Orrella daihaiensis]